MHLAERFVIGGTVNLDGTTFKVLGAYAINADQVRLDLQLVSEPVQAEPQPAIAETKPAAKPEDPTASQAAAPTS